MRPVGNIEGLSPLITKMHLPMPELKFRSTSGRPLPWQGRGLFFQQQISTTDT